MRTYVCRYGKGHLLKPACSDVEQERQIHRAGLMREPGTGAAHSLRRGLIWEGGQGNAREGVGETGLALELVWN